VINLLRAYLTPLAYSLLATTILGRLARGTLCTTVAIGAMLLAAFAPNASAGVFVVASCQADRLNYSTRAFTHFATQRMMIKRACNPQGPGMRGLVTANVVHAGRVKRGSIALVSIAAPPGTRMTTFSWTGTMRRRDCRYALEMWADAPDMQPITIKNVRANRRCPSPGRAQAAYDPPKDYNVAGATRIVQRIVCVGRHRGDWCSGRGRNYIRTYKASVGIVDDLLPSVEILPDTPLATGAWVSGTQPLNYTASDNVGIRLARALIDGHEHALHNRACLLAVPTEAFADPLPCPNGPGQMEVGTLRVTDGTHQLVVEALDTAGNAASSAGGVARIDNTPPARVDVSIEGGQTWRNHNDWLAVWANPTEVDRAPISGVTYELCAASSRSCSRASVTVLNVSTLPLTVPGPGAWTLSLWRQDAAGNQAEDNASVPVTLRYDPEPPQLAFEPIDATDPTQVAVRVTDQISGLADGAIEIGPAGSGAWQTLATQKDGNRLVTRIDDAALPPGTYVLRARARDQAGNEGSTDRFADGQPMVVTLPLRTPATLQAGFERTVRRKGRRRIGTVLRPTAHVRFAERATIAGRLATADGRAIAGAPVQVLSRTGAEPEQPIETLTTDLDGRFRTIASGTNTRALRFMYAGSPLMLPTERTLQMRVPAASTVRLSRKRLRNGQAVTFSGRVRGLPVPAAGKLVEVQVRFTDHWQTFRTTRSDAAGIWSSRYRFERTRGVQRYRFRIRLPKEGGYPFETSVSRTLVVEVHGR
jgi:hypothetical protein